MEKLQWFERTFTVGRPTGMLPFYIERLAGAIPRLESKVNGISEEMLSTRLDNKWSVKENIGHLAEVDEISLRRIDEVVAGISPMSSAVFEPKAYYEWAIAKVVTYFCENRRQLIARYEGLSPGDVQKTSLHPRIKLIMSPVDLAWFYAEHDDHHLVRIDEIIKSQRQP